MNAPVKDKRTDRIEERRASNALLDGIAKDAKPAEVSDPGKRKLFVAWLRAERTIKQCHQLMADALKDQENCAREIVQKLGRGHHRYDEVLFTTEAKGGTVYLRRLKQKAKE